MSTQTHDPTQAQGLAENALEEARSLIGVELRRQDHYWNTEANPDAVRHFCWGIGDENPLFCDPKYGESTRWKSGLAPGCFLFTIDSTVVAPKLRDISWFGHLMTNWAGDDGFIRRLNVTVKRPNIFGDVSWCRGTVVDKRVEEGAHLVELEVRIENQLGDVTADGTSIVELPAARPGA